MPEPKDDVLVCEDVVVQYGSAVAVDGVTLQVAEGEGVVVLGPNGAGKSTLLKAISGLKSPTSGEIRFYGRTISGASAPSIARLGLLHVPERREMFADLTVLENLQIASDNLVQRTERQASLDRIFEFFPMLAERRTSLAGVLSGGQQQILAIARAILPSPKLLILDEPTLGLSPKYSEEVLQTLLRLREQNTTMLLVEQKAHIGLRFASRGYVIISGRVALSGSAAELTTEALVDAYLGTN